MVQSIRVNYQKIMGMIFVRSIFILLKFFEVIRKFKFVFEFQMKIGSEYIICYGIVSCFFQIFKVIVDNSEKLFGYIILVVF